MPVAETVRKAVLRLNLLGEQRLTRQGADLTAGGSRAVELLAYLVVQPGIRVPRSVLAGTFWPESPQATAMTNLRRELHNLSRLLEGVDALGTSGGAIGVLPCAGLRVDVQVFSAERGAALQASCRMLPDLVVPRRVLRGQAARQDSAQAFPHRLSAPVGWDTCSMLA